MKPSADGSAFGVRHFMCIRLVCKFAARQTRKFFPLPNKYIYDFEKKKDILLADGSGFIALQFAYKRMKKHL